MGGMFACDLELEVVGLKRTKNNKELAYRGRKVQT